MASLQVYPRWEHGGNTSAAFHARIHELERAGAELQRAGIERERATEELRIVNEQLKSQLKEQEQQSRDLAKKNQELTNLLAKQVKDADVRDKECRSLKRQLLDQKRDFLRRLDELSRERGQAIQVMADEGHGLQARITRLEMENRALSIDLARVQTEVPIDELTLTPHNCSSSTEAGSLSNRSWSRSTFSRTSSREAFRLPLEEQEIRLVAPSTKAWPGKGRVDSGGSLNPTVEDDTKLKNEKIQLLECELRIHDRNKRLYRLENEKLKKRLDALEASGLIGGYSGVSPMHRSRSTDSAISFAR